MCVSVSTREPRNAILVTARARECVRSAAALPPGTARSLNIDTIPTSAHAEPTWVHLVGLCK